MRLKLIATIIVLLFGYICRVTSGTMSLYKHTLRLVDEMKHEAVTTEYVTNAEYLTANVTTHYTTVTQPHPLTATVTTISVSCLKVTWENGSDVFVDCSETARETAYRENICYDYDTPNACYITGLREGTEYQITTTDRKTCKTTTNIAKTETVNVIKTFDYEDGKTNCFAGEPATGLTLNPSKGAIAGAIQDPVTNTGIMRNEYGDYCVAMGLHYGRCGDRFLIELENGVQFTVKICDSKGYADDGAGKYHTFGSDGKCIVEFIFSDYLPENVALSGSWGTYDWDGLKFDNIKSIHQIEYGSTITY